MIRHLALISLSTFLLAMTLQAETTIWVTRHAEKADDGTQDPPLSDTGIARAAALADRLGGEKLVAVYTTKYRRTSDTAAPSAAAHGLTPIVYEPTDFRGLATEALRHDGHVLIVGHSNTVLPIIMALGGSPEGTIEESDYSRLYKVSITDEGRITTELITVAQK